MSTAAEEPATHQLAELLLLRFGGRQDRYLSERRKCVKEPVTGDVLLEHLSGQDRIGLYQTETVWYCGWDLDGKPPHGTEPAAWSMAEHVAAVLDADLELLPLLERTRSGLGYRVIVLFDPTDLPSTDEQQKFGRLVLRVAGLPDDCNEMLPGHPGLYPHPPGRKATGKTAYLPWGGLLNGGESRFLDRTTAEPLDDQAAVLEGAQLVTRSRLLGCIRQLEAQLADGNPAPRWEPPTTEGTEKPPLEQPPTPAARVVPRDREQVEDQPRATAAPAPATPPPSGPADARRTLPADLLPSIYNLTDPHAEGKSRHGELLVSY